MGRLYAPADLFRPLLKDSQFAFSHVERQPFAPVTPYRGKVWGSICVAGINRQGNKYRLISGMSHRNQACNYRKRTGGCIREYRGLVRVAIRPQACREHVGFCVVCEGFRLLKITDYLFALIGRTLIFDIRFAIIFLVFMRKANRRA